MLEARDGRLGLKVGQQVVARFYGWSEDKRGVISGEPCSYGVDGAVSYPVQFEPCGSHWICRKVSAAGSTDGWTDREYRIAREASSTREHADCVEAERREKYPDSFFSACRTLATA